MPHWLRRTRSRTARRGLSNTAGRRSGFVFMDGGAAERRRDLTTEIAPSIHFGAELGSMGLDPPRSQTSLHAVRPNLRWSRLAPA